MRLVIGLAVILACLSQAACSMPRLKLPRVHKVTIQQGNVITQRMVDELKPGLTRSQVAFIMGEPIFRNTFDDQRWDYLYSIEIPGIDKEQKRPTVSYQIASSISRIGAEPAPDGTPVQPISRSARVSGSCRPGSPPFASVLRSASLLGHGRRARGLSERCPRNGPVE